MTPSPIRPLRRLIVGIGVCGLVVVAASGVALVTRPASSSDAKPDTVQLVSPAADDDPTTTTAAPLPAGDEVAVRAEKAAGRAEVSADRAEVAATHVDQVVATTTTTAPTTTTTVTTGQPILVEVPHPTTTSTTTAPKRWVEIARFHRDTMPGAQAGPPEQAAVTLETGLLRVSGLDAFQPHGGIFNPSAYPMVWLGTDGTPTEACPSAPDNTGTVIDKAPTTSPDCVWRGSWPTGPQTISAGQYWAGGNDSAAGWRGLFTATGDVTVEEYR